MLALSFFFLIFTSLLWVIYAVMHIMDTIGVSGLQTAGLGDIAIYVAFVLLPVFAVWVIFGLISQFVHNHRFNQNLHKLFGQMKKNQDYSDLLARILLENEQQIRDGFVIGQFDLFISDMNELISEIIHRSSLASSEQIEHLWSKVRNGGKWAFGKVIIEVSQSQPTFQIRIFEKAQRDVVLAGTIMEFCGRYQNIVELFEKHDRERVFLNIIETGVLGKVFSIFAPISDELKRKREAAQTFQPSPEPRFEEKLATQTRPEPNFSTSSFAREPEFSPAAPSVEAVSETSSEQENDSFIKKFALSKKFPIFKKKREEGEDEYIDYRRSETQTQRDPFSIALERSFGSEDSSDTTNEPEFGIKPSRDTEAFAPSFDAPVATPEPEREIFVEAREGYKAEEPVFAKAPREEIPIVSNTQRTLDSLKREWENMRAPQVTAPRPTQPDTPEKEEAEDNFTYPFKSWVDEENYHK